MKSGGSGGQTGCLQAHNMGYGRSSVAPHLGAAGPECDASAQREVMDAALENSVKRQLGQQHSELILARNTNFPENVLERRSHIALGEVEPLCGFSGG